MTPKKPKSRLGHLQLAVLKSLWARGTATVNDVHGDLAPALDVAPTTVATVLRRMEASGLVRHTEQGRQYVYQAEVSEAEVAGSETADVLDRLFAGRLADMVSHVLSKRNVSPRELDELQKLIAEKRKQMGRK